MIELNENQVEASVRALRLQWHLMEILSLVTPFASIGPDGFDRDYIAEMIAVIKEKQGVGK